MKRGEIPGAVCGAVCAVAAVAAVWVAVAVACKGECTVSTSDSGIKWGSGLLLRRHGNEPVSDVKTSAVGAKDSVGLQLEFLVMTRLTDTIKQK